MVSVRAAQCLSNVISLFGFGYEAKKISVIPPNNKVMLKNCLYIFDCIACTLSRNK